MPLRIEYREVALQGESTAFRATLRRDAPSLRARLARPRRARAASLGAMLAVAAGLGPLGVPGALIEPATARASAASLQPVEQAGENFPGSAFYYLAPDSGVVAAARSASRAAGEPLDTMLGASIARPTFLAGTAQDRLRALQCLTTAIYYEAATEPDAGQRAVAQVVLNRVAHPAWPNSVCGVVYQGSERPGCQFSFACDGSMARAPARTWWLRARSVAEAALAGEVYAPVGLATHYHTGAVHPAWADRLARIGTIGAHLFYRPRGADGAASAFADAYLGGEPVPAPKPRAATPLAPRDPLTAYVEARGFTRATPAIPPAAPGIVAVPADTLPAASGIRPEYRNSGRWIAQPEG